MARGFYAVVTLVLISVPSLEASCPPGADAHVCDCEESGDTIEIECDSRQLRVVPDFSIFQGMTTSDLLINVK